MFTLDLKLALRTLRKSWGLTLFGGAAMAVAIALGASLFELLHVVTGTSVPLEDGDRLVVIQPFDPETRQARGTAPADFERWRAELESVEEAGAFRTVERDLVTPNGPAPPVRVAEISASGFRLAGVAPRLGRLLLPEDASAGAPPVVVLGYDAWQSTFFGDADIVGRDVQLDGVFHTVVGVMPEGFAFPVNHAYWIALRAGAPDPVVVFARLADGSTLAGAQAEVETLGLAEPSSATESGAALRARVVPYVTGIVGERRALVLALLPLILPLVLIPPCGNIAILVYARTVARQGELAARTALGATRARLVGQVFIEVLVLAALAAGLGLMLTPKLTEFVRTNGMPGVTPPFWMDFGLSYATIGYAAGLAVVAALIAGAIPALRATGRLSLACLQTLSARSAPKLGRVWTSLVLLQVALSVAILPIGAEIAWTISGPSVAGLRFAPDEYMTARLAMDPRAPVDPARFANVRDELVRRLEAEPGVGRVTVADALPSQEASARVDVEGAGAIETARFNRVDIAFFETFNTRVLVGRGFEAGDYDAASNAVVVNRSFARRVFGDGNPVGRRLRTLGERVAAGGADSAGGGGTGLWLEVVGVVEDFSPAGGNRAFYAPLPREPAAVPFDDGLEDVGAAPLSLAMHVGPSMPPELPGRLREIGAAVDPDLRVAVATLDDIYESFWIEDRTLASGLAGVLLGVVLFSVAGIYTLMTFVVVQRRREIGICVALGAPAWRLVAAILRRMLIPVAIGVALGGLAALWLDWYFAPVLFEFREGGRPLPWVLPAAEALLIFVAMLAAAGPVRQALRVDPVKDLREG